MNSAQLPKRPRAMWRPAGSAACCSDVAVLGVVGHVAGWRLRQSKQRVSQGGLHENAGVQGGDALNWQSYLSSASAGRATLSYVPALLSILAMRTIEAWRSLSRRAL